MQTSKKTDLSALENTSGESDAWIIYTRWMLLKIKKILS